MKTKLGDFVPSQTTMYPVRLCSGSFVPFHPLVIAASRHYFPSLGGFFEGSFQRMHCSKQRHEVVVCAEGLLSCFMGMNCF